MAPPALARAPFSFKAEASSFFTALGVLTSRYLEQLKSRQTASIAAQDMKYVCMYKVSLQEKQTPNGTPCAMDARNHNAWNLVCIIMFPLLPPQRYGT